MYWSRLRCVNLKHELENYLIGDTGCYEVRQANASPEGAQNLEAGGSLLCMTQGIQ